MSVAYNIKMFFLNIWKRAIKGSFIEKYIASKTQGKDWTDIFIRLAPTLQHYSPHEYRDATRNNIRYRLYPHDYDDYVLYYGLKAEPREALLKLIKNGMVIFDIGTNIGEVLLTMATLDTGGELHAFEPLPSIYARAKNNIELNSFSNIRLNNIAL